MEDLSGAGIPEGSARGIKEYYESYDIVPASGITPEAEMDEGRKGACLHGCFCGGGAFLHVRGAGSMRQGVFPWREPV